MVNQFSVFLRAKNRESCIVIDRKDEFLNRLRAAIRRGGGNAAVSKAAAIPLSTLNTWLSGQTEAKIWPLMRIAEACGTTVAALIGETGDTSPPARLSVIQDAVRRGGGAALVARALHVGEPTIRRMIEGDYRAPEKLLRQLAQVADMPETRLLETQAQPSAERLVHLPVIDVQASAGDGAFAPDSPDMIDTMPISAADLHRLGVNAVNARVIRATGDSMYPTIADGARVIVNIAATEVVDGGIYLIRAPAGLLLKRLQRTINGGIQLISDNSALYAPERLDGADMAAIVAVGRAIWTERWL
jgi:phage repressor protein C with HTH and peptisase S24 domain/DNA-binding phage protein